VVGDDGPPTAAGVSSGEQPLVCPGCAREYPPSERFCAACGMPLVHMSGGTEQAVSERQQRARKIKPQYSEGKLVKVAAAQNGAEAEMIQGLLLEEGIPSMLRRSPGADVPSSSPGDATSWSPNRERKRPKKRSPGKPSDRLDERRLAGFACNRFDLLGGAFELRVGEYRGALERKLALQLDPRLSGGVLVLDLNGDRSRDAVGAQE